MELSQLKPLERTIEILNPKTETPLGVRIRLVSIDDDRMKNLMRTLQDQHLKRSSKGVAIKSDELKNNTYMMLFTASTGWEWYNPTGEEGDNGFDADMMPKWNDEIPEYNQRNFIKLLTEFPHIFADQLNEALDDKKAFFADSKRS